VRAGAAPRQLAPYLGVEQVRSNAALEDGRVELDLAGLRAAHCDDVYGSHNNSDPCRVRLRS
jgi:hypothetical protein